MRLYRCRLTFHENLFYATREIGRLYETGHYLHNYALTYALGLARSPSFQPVQIPSYAEQLTPLNERGIYVTPARGVNVRFELNTFKYANNRYHARMEPGKRNTPSYGRAKEVAVGSLFEFAILSPEQLHLPRWVRMGLWASKAMVELLEEAEPKLAPAGAGTASYPLNPLDVPGRLLVYDLISMPPSSLVDHARIEGQWWECANTKLPANMAFTFPGQA